MSKLWDHLSSEHGLILVGSELNDILELARQEIELPDEEEIERQFPTKKMEYSEMDKQGMTGFLYYQLQCHEILMRCNKDKQEGVRWALNKVRNPYPKQINP